MALTTNDGKGIAMAKRKNTTDADDVEELDPELEDPEEEESGELLSIRLRLVGKSPLIMNSDRGAGRSLAKLGMAAQGMDTMTERKGEETES
jgi:hypothetical protein